MTNIIVSRRGRGNMVNENYLIEEINKLYSALRLDVMRCKMEIQKAVSRQNYREALTQSIILSEKSKLANGIQLSFGSILKKEK